MPNYLILPFPERVQCVGFQRFDPNFEYRYERSKSLRSKYTVYRER